MLLLIQFSYYDRPSPLILNELGQTIDATTGQAIQLAHHTPTLKVSCSAASI